MGGGFRFLEWEEMDGGARHAMSVEDAATGRTVVSCRIEEGEGGDLAAEVVDWRDGRDGVRRRFIDGDGEGRGRLAYAEAWCEAEAESMLEDPAPERITRAAVAKGFLAGAVRLGVEPGERGGTVCWVGDNWFFFDTPDADGMDPVAYVEAKGMERAVELVAGALEDLEDDPDEHGYYEAVLRERGCM